MSLEKAENRDTWKEDRLYTGLCGNRGCEVSLEKAENRDTWKEDGLYTGFCGNRGCEVSLEKAKSSDTWPGRLDFGAGREHVRRYLLYLCESEPARRTEMAM